MKPAVLSESGRSKQLHVVTREDRIAEFAGLRLLLASLYRHCPGVLVTAYLRSEHIAIEGEQLRLIHPFVGFVPMDDVDGWACKPTVLLDALSRELDNETLIVWMDTDIIVMREFSEIADTPPGVVLSAEESNPNPNHELVKRQQFLGLVPGVPRKSTISSAVVGVRRCHKGLLEEWKNGVDKPQFKEQQTLPHHQRLIFGDQEVWEAVLCTPEFQKVDVRLLRNFNELLQATYTSYVRPVQMKQSVAPYFVHATGDLKPWRTSRMRFAQEMFPYFDIAQCYLSALPSVHKEAFVSTSPAARIFKGIFGFGVYTLVRRVHHRLTIAKRLIG